MDLASDRHVLLVDDDPVVLALLVGLFSNAGYRVSEARDGRALRAALAADSPDLVVLDINLPDESGFVLAREVRARTRAGLIMLTCRTQAVDRLNGLELGADDYLTKPFDEQELLVRARNLLRRVPSDAGVLQRQYTYRFAGWCFDPFKHLLEPAVGEQVNLTRAESDLLHALLARPQVVHSRQQLLDAIHGRGGGSAGDRTVDVLVLRLRRKLGDDPKAPQLIATVPGTGYYFAGAVAAE
jgi:two-component system torCAD operon response regulator TorR